MERARFLLLLSCVGVPACSTDTAPTDPIEPPPASSSGSLELTIEETGPRPDTDGYEVSITLATQVGPVVRTLPQGGGSFLFPDLPLGMHVLRVEGLASHCSVTGNHPRAFTVRPGATFHVALGIFCPGPGAVLVKTVTRGRDVGVSEYSVSIQGDSALEISIGTTDSILIGEEDLPEGRNRVVQLSGVPDNCSVDLPPMMSVGTLRGSTRRLEYAVVCLPRGTRIAFEYQGAIFLTTGSEAIGLSTFRGTSDRGPSLSPDGSRVVFTSVGWDLGFDLFVVDADGSGGGQLTTDAQGSYVGPQAWSPDGARIVFWRERAGFSDIYVMNADGSEVQLTFGGVSTSPAWSPDGRSIAFCRFEGRRFEAIPAVYRMSAMDGSGLTKVAEDGCSPVWSPDGSKIAFTFRPMALDPDLAVIGSDGSGFTRLHPSGMTSEESSQRPSWSPDGSQIAYVGGRTASWIWIVEFDGSAFGAAFPFRFGSAPSWR